MVEQQPFIAPPQKAEDHEHQRLSNRSPPTNCLSVEDHDHDITDPLAHFLGCIEIGERNDFFSDKNRIWKDELEYQQSLGNEQDGASELVKNLKERWKNNIDSELKRIALLRKTLAEEENDGPLVSAVDKSREEWRQSHEYQRNIRKVREWRQEHQMSVSNLEPEDNEAEANELEGYELEKDISVPVIQFDKEKEYSEDGFKGKFPNQKTTVHKLLYEVASKPEDELLHRNRDFNNGRIKYFHIPSNNMIVSVGYPASPRLCDET
jgi:hypothetical protein